MLVPVAVLTVVGMTEAGYVAAGKKPTMKPVIGGFLLGIALLAIQGINYHLGSMFCLLVVVASLLEHGAAVFKLIGG